MKKGFKRRTRQIVRIPTSESSKRRKIQWQTKILFPAQRTRLTSSKCRQLPRRMYLRHIKNDRPNHHSFHLLRYLTEISLLYINIGNSRKMFCSIVKTVSKISFLVGRLPFLQETIRLFCFSSGKRCNINVYCVGKRCEKVEKSVGKMCKVD